MSQFGDGAFECGIALDAEKVIVLHLSTKNNLPKTRIVLTVGSPFDLES
jgi:hypothetical protein